MAYDYISLVNDINRRLNEVELTSANFPTALLRILLTLLFAMSIRKSLSGPGTT